MSSYAPPGLSTQRATADLSSNAGRSGLNGHANANGGLRERVGDFFGESKRESLPMYKDKPYAYPGQARPPIYKRRKGLLLALAAFSAVSWWFGILSPLSFLAGRAGSTSDSSGGSAGAGAGKAPSTSWFYRPTGASDWAARAEKVKETFKISFSGYEKHAWGFDEFSPVSKRHRQMTQEGLGWIIIDALDTMMLMNLSDELARSRKWLHNNLTWEQDHDVNTFETTIRMLGGLLSAHYLSTEFPDVYAPVHDGLSDDLYIEKATDLADRLLGAYESKSGVPFASINLKTAKGIPSHDDGGASSTAEATTLQLEMKYLAHLTGEDHYWHTAEKVMKVVDDNNARDGLVPIYIHADRGTFRGSNIRLGSRGDSYYEYLIKQYLQTSRQEPIYQEMWNDTLAGVKKHLITYSSPSNFTVLAERPSGLDASLSPKMDHLVCFMPGTIALATTLGRSLKEARAQPNWGSQQEEDMRLAEELMNTCWGMYKVTPSGLAGEITHFALHDPPLMYEDFPASAKPASPAFSAAGDGDATGKTDFIIKPGDAHNLQRPETVESLFYMWRITGEQKYRDWGWEMFENFVRWMATDDGEGYSSLSSVLQVPPPLRDNMESFWLAETLKYFYLLFSPDTILPLTDVVFNTEAHPFPHFSLGKLFATGWQRIPRDAAGNLVRDGAAAAEQTTPLQNRATPPVPPRSPHIAAVPEAARAGADVVDAAAPNGDAVGAEGGAIDAITGMASP